MNCPHMNFNTAMCIAQQLAAQTGHRRRLHSQRHTCGALIWHISFARPRQETR